MSPVFHVHRVLSPSLLSTLHTLLSVQSAASWFIVLFGGPAGLTIVLVAYRLEYAHPEVSLRGMRTSQGDLPIAEV